MRSATAMWDFWSLSPESLHQVTILMSDRGLPQGYRFMNGYGSHTFSFINAANQRTWVKLHFKSMQGHKHWTNDEANAIIATDRESAQRDLFDSIEKGEFPKWRFCIQVMTDAQAKSLKYNPFDLTKVWGHKDFPLTEVGVLELNENAENYFAEIEQSSFSPSNIVPGVGFSPDKMLQGRLFAYADAHRYRVGTHYEMLPVNRPLSPVNSYHMDGSMRFDSPRGTDAYYEPNSFNGPVQDNTQGEPPLPLEGDAGRYDHRAGNDDYIQAGDLFRLFDEGQRHRLFANIAAAMQGVPAEIVERQLAHFRAADPAYGAGVEAALKTAHVAPDNSAPRQATEHPTPAQAAE